MQGANVPSQIALQAMVDNFIRTTPPDQQQYQLMVLGKEDPFLARAIQQHLMTIQKGMALASPKPLSEQKPPTRGAATAVI